MEYTQYNELPSLLDKLYCYHCEFCYKVEESCEPCNNIEHKELKKRLYGVKIEEKDRIIEEAVARWKMQIFGPVSK
jgi:hypothetical protein